MPPQQPSNVAPGYPPPHPGQPGVVPDPQYAGYNYNYPPYTPQPNQWQ